jgi:hypothetical protein
MDGQKDEGRLDEQRESFQIAGGWNSGMDKGTRSEYMLRQKGKAAFCLTN